MAVDYAMADRSQGYAIEDIRFAKAAQWAGLITSSQYQEAFNRQNAYVDSGQAPPPIGDVLHKMRALTRAGEAAILHYRSLERPNQEDDDLLRLAVQNEFLDKAKAEEVRKLQKELVQEGLDSPPLACLLYEKRYLHENQILALLQKQAGGQAGLIYRVQTDVEENTETTSERFLGAKGTPQRKFWLFALVGLLVLVALMATRKAVTAPPKYINTFCVNCETRGGLPFNTDWPAKCKDCATRTPSVYPLAICKRCGHSMVVKDKKLPKACPDCGARDKVIWFTADINEKDLKDKGGGHEQD